MGVRLRPVETRAGSKAHCIDVLELSRSRDRRDIANLGLTLPEAKRLLARVQQAVVAVQAREYSALRPACSGCGVMCHVKDWQSRQIATLFGAVAMRLPGVRAQRGRTKLARALPLDP